MHITSGPNLCFTINHISSLPKKHFSMSIFLTYMLKKKRENLTKVSEHQIMSVGEQRFSVKPDNPENWIIVSVFYSSYDYGG